MSNTAPRLEYQPTPLPAEQQGYQRHYDDPVLAAAVEDRMANQPLGELAPIETTHLSEAGVHNEQSSRWGNMWDNYRYKGAHRARRDEPSSHDRSALTPSDEALKGVLQEVREQAYTDALVTAAADGASDKAAEVRARSAAQTAVSDYYQDIQKYTNGKHTAKGQARNSGSHARSTLRSKAVEWLTYSPDEVVAQEQQKVDNYERKHPVARLRGSGASDVFIPNNVYTQRGRDRQIKASRAERRYQQAVGAVDKGEFEQGRVATRPESRSLAPLTSDTAEGQLIDLVESGARTREEIFNQIYGARTVGGSGIYGGKTLSENPGLWRKISEAGTTNRDNVGPVEHATADRYAAWMQPVIDLENQVTSKFVPSETIIEGMLFGENTRPDALTEDQRLLVKIIHERLEGMRSQKMASKLRPGETFDARVKMDRLRSLRETWRDTREAMKGLKGKTERAVGIVAMHGAMWTASARTTLDNIVRPGYIPEPRHNSHHDVTEGREAWRDRIDPTQPAVESIRIYSPGELVQLASSWAFVRAQMIAGGTLRGARDLFRPRDIETGERNVSMLRLAGAAAVLATAATISYGYYMAHGGNVNLDIIQADLGLSDPSKS